MGKHECQKCRWERLAKEIREESERDCATFLKAIDVKPEPPPEFVAEITFPQALGAALFGTLLSFAFGLLNGWLIWGRS